MRTYTLFQKYIWMVNTIKRTHGISLEDLNRRWMNTSMSDGQELARTTFNRHKSAIEEMFGIEIVCDKRNGYKYFIKNEEVLEEESIQNWMLSTLSVSNLLSESKGVHDRIILEPIPSDGENLHMFIEAMQKNFMVQVRYRRYGAEHETQMRVEPYFVKLFSKRWYGFVKFSDSDWLFPLAFDRIQELTVTDIPFEFNSDFVAGSYLKDNYGVVVNEEAEVKRIVIRAFGKEAYYLRDLPLHHSQKEIETTDEWSDFELQMKVTSDVLSPLLARGPYIKILEPKFLAEEIMYQHEDAMHLYDDEIFAKYRMDMQENE